MTVGAPIPKALWWAVIQHLANDGLQPNTPDDGLNEIRKAFIAIQKYDSYRTASDKSQAMWQGMPTFSIKPTSELPKLKKKIAEIVLDRIAINSEFIEGTPAASAELFPRVIVRTR